MIGSSGSYGKIMSRAAALQRGGGLKAADLPAWLGDELSWRWRDAYLAMPGSTSDICLVDQAPYTYVFDLGAERVVVAYGCSIATAAPRPAARMAGFLGKMSDRFAGRGDKGHIMSHKQGGGTDINLFPQRPDVNRGRSDRGRAYRRLEIYCAAHPGTFCFSRLIYADASWVPHEIQYGVLADGSFRIEQFGNAAN